MRILHPLLFCLSDCTGAAQPARTHITFVTDWKAQAEHGGFYEALAEGLYAKRGLDVTIRAGGPQMNVPQLLAGGAADFGIGSNSFIALNLVKQNVPLRAVMAIFQKDPQVLISHPRRDLTSLEEMRGRPILISDARHDQLLALAEGALGISPTARSANTRSIWRRSWSIPTRSRKAISPASPSPIEQPGAFRAQGFSAGRLRLSRLRQHGAGAAEMDRHQSQGGAGLL